jgi:hypothetical protein
MGTISGRRVQAAVCALCCNIALAETAPPVVLEVQLENVVNYVRDVADPAKLATSALPVNVAPGLWTFSSSVILADVVAVNGVRVKGTATVNLRLLNVRPGAAPGAAVGDTVRTSISDYAVEILHEDGTPIGSIYAAGYSGGPAPPGACGAAVGSNNAVAGGTGAFLGVRGQLGAGRAAFYYRNASAAEDPFYRRVNGGGKFPMIIHLLPAVRPEIDKAKGGPAILHAEDWAPLSHWRPARAGELLVILASGLGPTRPAVEPGAAFPSEPLAVVNSPVEVLWNGTPAEVVNAIGYPGKTDGYRVDFRVPSDAGPGTASVQLRVAWIPGSAVTINVK